MIRIFAMVLAFTASPLAAAEALIVQSTTSTVNSGLYDHLLPAFEDKTGIAVNVVAVGTDQAIRNAANCDGDVLLIHAKAEEEEFVASGGGVSRPDLMYNDFVLVGPPANPASISGSTSVEDALTLIAEGDHSFA
jgi:tungstate transport system substrate-binding protein